MVQMNDLEAALIYSISKGHKDIVTLQKEIGLSGDVILGELMNLVEQGIISIDRHDYIIVKKTLFRLTEKGKTHTKTAEDILTRKAMLIRKKIESNYSLSEKDKLMLAFLSKNNFIDITYTPPSIREKSEELEKDVEAVERATRTKIEEK